MVFVSKLSHFYKLTIDFSILFQIFDGNCDHFTPVMNLVKKMPVARYIRFHPIRYIGAMCLRVEVYGC